MSKLSVCDIVVESIIEKIRSGELRPGDRLPNEKDLAAQYNVSAISLREALRVLAARGLLVTKHGIGTFVNTYNPDLIAQTFYYFSLLDQSPLLEMLQLRKIMETQSARLCATHATEDEIKTIKFHKTQREYYCELPPSPENIKCKYEHDRLFHFNIAKASHNEIFYRFIESISRAIDQHQAASSLTEQDVRNTTYYHSEIMKAIENHQINIAGDMMWKHMETIEAAMKEQF